MPAVRPIPPGSEGVIAHLVVAGGEEALAFYAAAFGADVQVKLPGPGGKLMHSEIVIGNGRIYVADDWPEWGTEPRDPRALGNSPVVLHRYVEDVDAAVARAVEAGATVSMEPADMFWGDRYGKVLDPFGHEWSLATHIADPTPEEMAAAAAALFGEASPPA